MFLFLWLIFFKLDLINKSSGGGNENNEGMKL